MDVAILFHNTFVLVHYFKDVPKSSNTTGVVLPVGLLFPAQGHGPQRAKQPTWEGILAAGSSSFP